jgi:hypothetical protein
MLHVPPSLAECVIVMEELTTEKEWHGLDRMLHGRCGLWPPTRTLPQYKASVPMAQLQAQPSAIAPSCVTLVDPCLPQERVTQPCNALVVVVL